MFVKYVFSVLEGWTYLLQKFLYILLRLGVDILSVAY